MPLDPRSPAHEEPQRDEPGQPPVRGSPSSEPGDDYFSSGAFSPVTVRLGDDDVDSGEADEEVPRRAPDEGEGSPQVIVQFGEDPGAVPADEPD